MQHSLRQIVNCDRTDVSSRLHSGLRASVACAVVCTALASTDARAQSVIRSVPGATGERLGAAICDAGDINGDGWNDYLVGAPSANGGRGGVVCISGKYLATSIAPSQLYSFYPSATQVSADAAFGWAIANLGDVTGDNIADFAIGAPYQDAAGYIDCGGVALLNGATHALTGQMHVGFLPSLLEGWSLSGTSDYDGDGWPDVLVGCPTAAGQGTVSLLSGHSLGTFVPHAFWSINLTMQSDRCGYAVLGGVDFDGDGVADLVMTAPDASNGGANRGVVFILSGTTNHSILADYWGLPGQHLGISLASGADFDGDGRQDLVVGARFSSTGTPDGEVVVLSPQHIINGVPPFEIFAWDGPPSGTGLFAGSAFGASVAIAPDLNGDGRSDILVGAPLFAQAISGSHGNYGAVAIYSGLTGAQMGWLSGANSERIGSAVLGSVNDLDGDGRYDFVVGGAGANVPSLNCGVFKAARLFPTTPVNYCIGKVNSLGCTPAMTYSGNASTTSPSPFLIGAGNVLNKKNGLLFYGFMPLANPFQGGVLCVKAPTVRTVMQNSGGSATGNDCTGTFSFDFNAFIQGGGHPQLVTGKEVFCQYWSRDPQSPSTTSLSDALSFVINP